MKAFFKKTFATDNVAFKDSIALLILRLFTGGALLLAHGLGKIDKGPAALPNPFDINPTFNGILIIFAEVVCAGAILLGFATRWAAFVVAICMGVAFFIFHANDPFQNKELALAYFTCSVVLIFMGSGMLSIDRFLGKK